MNHISLDGSIKINGKIKNRTDKLRARTSENDLTKLLNSQLKTKEFDPVQMSISVRCQHCTSTFCVKIN